MSERKCCSLLVVLQTTWSSWSTTCGNMIKTRTCVGTTCDGVYCSGNPSATTYVCCRKSTSPPLSHTHASTYTHKQLFSSTAVPPAWASWGSWSTWTGACGGTQSRVHTRICTTPCGDPVCTTGASSETAIKPCTCIYVYMCVNENQHILSHIKNCILL